MGLRLDRLSFSLILLLNHNSRTVHLSAIPFTTRTTQLSTIMKTLAAVAALVGIVAAQSLSDLPPCGQTCVNNMLGQAAALGCSATDVACLCKNDNFGFGIRDCSYQACPPDTNVAAIIAYGNSYCASVASTASGDFAATSALTASGTASGPAGSASGISTLTGGAGGSGSATATGSGTAGGAGGSSAASNASSGASSVASGASASASSVASSLSSQAASASSAASNVGASASSSAASVGSSISSRVSSATGAAGSAGNSATSSAGGAASSAAPSASGNFAPMVTVAANGLVGVAGLAAVMLLCREDTTMSQSERHSWNFSNLLAKSLLIPHDRTALLRVSAFRRENGQCSTRDTIG